MTAAGIVHVDKTECARAIDPATGDVITVSHVKYNMPHYATGSDNEFYVERSHNGNVISASGWESEAQALAHVTGYPEPEKHTVYGKEVERVGLGIPDALLIRSKYSFTSEQARKDAQRVSDQKAATDAAARKREIDDAVNAAVAAHKKITPATNNPQPS